MKLALGMICLLMTACSIQPTRQAEGARGIASVADAEACWGQLRASHGDYRQMGLTRAGCQGQLLETYAITTDPANNQFTVTVRLRNYDTYNVATNSYEDVVSAPLTLAQVGEFLAPLRNATTDSTASMPAGPAGTLKSSYGRIALRDPKSGEVELISIESYLKTRAEQCLKEKTVDCDDGLLISERLDWVYDTAFAASYDVATEGTKSAESINIIRRWTGQDFVPVRSIVEVVPEAGLVAALKTDWIIRGSNVAAAAAPARTLKELLSKFRYNPESKERVFRSYSIRLKPEMKSRVQACMATGQGADCLARKKVILYNYSFADTAFTQDFKVIEVTPKSVRVAIPFGWESATDDLRFDVPVRQAHFVHLADSGTLKPWELRNYGFERCSFAFPKPMNFIDGSVPPLMKFAECPKN